tara:strand:+ start:180 stop:1292 length:1113 start_codon:yes stop_codon:yes gene_type:complete
MKKKILVISHDFVKKVNIRIYEELNKKKNLELLCVRPKKLFVNQKYILKDYKKENSSVKILEKRTVFSNLRFLYFKNIFNIIQKYRPTHIIVHNDPVSFQTILLIAFSFFRSFSISCISNENKVLKFFQKFEILNFLRSSSLFFLNLFVRNKIKHIFCITKQIKKNYNFLGYENKTILMPLGFDQNIFKKNNFNKNKIFTISYFGRISPDKGIHILIEALKKIKFEFRFFLDVSHIDNNEYQKDIIFRLKKILPRKNIKLIKCDHFKIAKFMSKSNLVVLPSLYDEQYGRVIQEAVGCGSLVIGSKAGGIPEIINDNDLLFEKGNIIELANKINRLSNRNFYKTKLQQLETRIINERTLKKQLSVLEKFF